MKNFFCTRIVFSLLVFGVVVYTTACKTEQDDGTYRILIFSEIEKTDFEGVTLSAPKNARSGELVLVDMAFDDNYDVAPHYLVSDGYNQISANLAADNKFFTFTMPESDVMLNAWFQKKVSLLGAVADGDDFHRTTKLTLTFDNNVPGLTRDNYTITGISGVGTAGTPGAGAAPNEIIIPITNLTNATDKYISLRGEEGKKYIVSGITTPTKLWYTKSLSFTASGPDENNIIIVTISGSDFVGNVNDVDDPDDDESVYDIFGDPAICEFSELPDDQWAPQVSLVEYKSGTTWWITIDPPESSGTYTLEIGYYGFQIATAQIKIN